MIRRYEFKLNKGETAESVENEAFARRLLAQFGPDAEEPIRRIQVYTFHARLATRWRQGRVFLAGDAAHLTPPFAGQGLNSGLRDAHNLAWKLDEALRAPTTDVLLDSYETERKPHAQSMIDLALRMGQVMMPASPLQGHLVRGAFHTLGLVPAARDYFAQMKYKPKPRFKAGLITKDKKPHRKTIVGSLIPQPLVELPDGKVQLLDELLPDRPVALIYGERPEEALSPDDLAELLALGAAVFGLTPEWCKAVQADFPTGRDASRLLAQAPYLGYLDHVLLLRRDRYVAAAAPVGALQPIRDTLGMLKNQTRAEQP